METLSDKDRHLLGKAFADHAIGCDTCMTVVMAATVSGQDRRETETHLCVVGRALGAAYPLGKGGAQ